jgi:DNA mismatch repair ATPase MutS
VLATSVAHCQSPLLIAAAAALAIESRWAELLARAIAAEPAAAVREGNVIAAGYDAELDDCARSGQLRRVLVDLEARERQRQDNQPQVSSTACTASISKYPTPTCSAFRTTIGGARR